MAESAIEKLMRLKREKAGEASAVGGADLSPSSPKEPEALKSSKVETPPAKEEPKKELSAMEKLRAIKMGTPNAKQASGSVDKVIGHTTSDVCTSNNNGNSSSVTTSSASSELAVQLKEEPKIQKPRKTHPLAMEMAELEAALDDEVPGFVSILSTIHKKLKADPECVTLLDDEEIGRIVAGLEKHTNVTIVSPNAVKAAKKASKVPVTAADL